jgi:hypothetical protein
MGASLRMLERDLKVARESDCISAASRHSRGGVPPPSQRALIKGSKQFTLGAEANSP